MIHLNHPIKYIIGFAIIFHLLLFSIATPLASKKQPLPTPPKTTYMFPQQNSTNSSSTQIQQNIWSPLLFAFPSEVGFSRDYLKQRLQTRITFPAPEKTEYFLKISLQELFGIHSSTETQKLLTRPQKTTLPIPQNNSFIQSLKKTTPPRYRFSSNLKSRINLPLTFSDLLNRPTSKPWGIRARVSVSAYGRVTHLFLQNPIKDPTLNQAILLWIYNLQFKPALQSTTGTIELFSPYPKIGDDL